jgi:hypothetical protein
VPRVGLGSDNATWSFMEFIRGKYKRASKLSDEAKLTNYVNYHRKCRRMEKNRWINGAYVENEMICAVAHQHNIVINVAQQAQPELHVITPDGSFMRFDDHRAEQSPFFLWCTGGHYQALVKIRDFEVLSSALSAPPYIHGNVLNSADIRIPQ